MNSEEVAACVEIQQLAYRYAFSVDSRDVDTLASLFWPLDGSDPAAFQATVHERLKTNLAKVGVSFLNVGNTLVSEIDGDRARGYVYTKSEFELDGKWCEQAILYQDKYVRVEGRWYFGERDHQLWYGAPRGVDPLSLQPANWPASQLGVGTIPFVLESWQNFWGDDADRFGAGWQQSGE